MVIFIGDVVASNSTFVVRSSEPEVVGASFAETF
jgi:hypothetical protein